MACVGTEKMPEDVPDSTKVVLSTTWAMKKKLDGTYQARLNVRSFEQVDGVHYDKDTKSAPVVADAIILVFCTVCLATRHSIDVRLNFMRELKEAGLLEFM